MATRDLLQPAPSKTRTLLMRQTDRQPDSQTARQPDSSPALDKHWTALGSRLEPTRCWRAHAWPYST